MARTITNQEARKLSKSWTSLYGADHGGEINLTNKENTWYAIGSELALLRLINCTPGLAGFTVQYARFGFYHINLEGFFA